MKTNFPKRLSVELDNPALKQRFRSKVISEGGSMKIAVEKFMIGYLNGTYKMRFEKK